MLPLNIEAVVEICVDSEGRASALKLSSVKFNGQATIPAPLMILLNGVGLGSLSEQIVSKDQGGGDKNSMRGAAVALLRGLANLL